MTNKLKINIAGIDFENPFILSSAPPTAHIDSILKAFELGWGGAVLKTITPDSTVLQDATPRFTTMKNGQRVVGFENIETLSHKNLQYWKDGIVELKSKFPNRVVIASIMAPVKKEDWQNLVLDLQKFPLDAFELNFSCPNGVPEKKMGMAIGTDKEIANEIASWVMEVSNKPVFVKLTPNVTDIEEITEYISKNANPTGFSAINTVQSLMAVNIDTFNPEPDVSGYSAFGGYSGEAVRPIGLRCVAQVRQATDKPILGMGGISKWQDAVQYIAVGANAVQVCTEVMVNGYGVIKQMLAGLSEYMDSHNFNSINDFRNKTISKIQSHEVLYKQPRMTAAIDKLKCVACGKCCLICDESGYQAINKSKDGKYEVEKSKCDGCSLCTHICPKDAIRME